MHNRLKISHRRHSGRLRPHEYTSYPGLFLILLIVGFALTVSSVAAVHPPPQSGSVGLSGTMPGKPPSVAAVIKTPNSGQHFNSSPITVSGTCPDNTVVEVFKNDIFGGSGACNNGNFSFSVDLLYGQNTLVAKAFDALNQAAPDSNKVSVSYDVLPTQGSPLSPLTLTGSQLLLSTTTVYRGIFPGQTLSVPLSILGGSAPYAVDVQWGDSTDKIVPRDNNLSFDVTHSYNKPGVYQISTQATDGQSRVAFLTVAAIVNGQPVVASTASSNTPSKETINKLLVLWPLYVTAAGMVISFWYGERREKHILGGAYLTLHPQG